MLRYTDINLSCTHLVRVSGLIHLEILLYHLRSINNLLTFDYPTVTQLTVAVLANLLQHYTQDL